MDIFIGIVYYQRLRHMISDKSQVRATGPVHNLTMQPVKGRKRHGGIRLGEMERDALIGHGLSYSLCDRLLDCSDRTLLYYCRNPECSRSLPSATGFGTSAQVDPMLFPPSEGEYFCQRCHSMQVARVAMPYICRYLTNELAGMNVEVALRSMHR
mmetsp:Transcript_14648/g.47701  ORF Transcript_14648/g.47701 Transcript_14648/m.47701 type:complete len:155 (+) Transcript_14648:434-898(+)